MELLSKQDESLKRLRSKKEQPSLHYMALYYGKVPYPKSVTDCAHVQYITVDMKKPQYHLSLRDCIQYLTVEMKKVQYHLCVKGCVQYLTLKTTMKV